MAKENVEIVRAMVAELNRGDWEAALEYVAPDFEVDFSRAVGPVHGVFKLDQFRALLDEFFEQWEAVRFEMDELIEVGDEVVTALISANRGRDGIEVQARASFVWTLRDRSVVSLRMYQELDDAKEATGLTEQSSLGPRGKPLCAEYEVGGSRVVPPTPPGRPGSNHARASPFA